jgi:hypothetical protein
MAIEPVSFPMPNGTTARGFCTGTSAVEYVVVRHEMGDGSFAEERVWRAIPLPAPAAEEAAPEDADG